ncbi:MAG: DNA polymerase IV [Oscillospiraceae bacterium]|nr:DNA polymerase IV [Oscillospiraceae bacterium]MDD3833816.1 DNA polymerase IV [Oscillospiraceae bacterium]
MILHCDMNNYFATVEEKFDSKLRIVPFAVCGDPEMRHSIVMAKNNLAKKAGVITGISFHQAKEICPGLGYVKADYHKYLAETKFARKIYKKYTDTIIPYGLDESWIDLTETGVSLNDGKQIADIIRLEIMYTQGLSASVGVSDNLIFAKLGSDYKKPNATTMITRENYKQVLWPLPASDLLFVGGQRKKVLSKIGIHTIGDIALAEPQTLNKLLGKVGYDLWQFANGDDRSFKPDNDKIGSIGNTITPPEDLHTPEEVSAILYLIATSISTRLNRHNLKACCISITTKDNRFNTITRQCSVSDPTNSVNIIFNQAYALFQRNYRFYYPLRSVGVRVNNLVSGDYLQFSLFKEEANICVDIDERIKKLTARFGRLSLEKTSTSKEWI